MYGPYGLYGRRVYGLQRGGMGMGMAYRPPTPDPTEKDIQLLEAATQGHSDRVEALVSEGASVRAKHDPDQRTVLHAAAENGHLEVVKLLLDKSASIDKTTASGKSALSLAAANGHQEVATVLLRGRADVNHTDNGGRSPLHEAADCQDLPMMQLLLAAGADIDAGDEDGCAPLHLASQANNGRAAAMLVTFGAAVGAKCDKGYTPLHYAAEAGHLKLVQQLLGAKAYIDAQSTDGSTPLCLASKVGYGPVVQQLLRSGADLFMFDHSDSIALHVAAKYGRTDVVQRLLRADATPAHVDAQGGEGQTPLHMACSTGHSEVVQLLLKAGADVNAKNVDGYTPLHNAAERGHMGVLQLLLSSGAQHLTADNTGWLALHAAANEGRVEVVRHLLCVDATAAHVNAVNGEGSLPLHMASSKGHSEVVQPLLGAGADVHARDAEDCTPLHAAAKGGHLAVVQRLLAAGADPAAASAAGVTGLSQAAVGGHLSVLEALLAALGAGQGGNQLDVQHLGRTPLQWALEEGHISCVKALAAAGADVNVLYGADAEAADGTSLAGASTLHRAVQLQRTALVRLLATPSNMGRLWQGQTALHMALSAGDSKPQEEEGAAVQMAQALVAAGSPVAVANADGRPAMLLAAGSSSRGLRELLPAMVRHQCELYKQQQQKQQQQEEEEGQAKQHGVANVPSEVVSHVYLLLEVMADAAGLAGPALGAACFRCMMDVLGDAAASSLLHGLLAMEMGMRATPGVMAADCSVPLLLSRTLHRGWCKEVLPLMQQRWRLINRLQKLVPQDRLQQAQLQTQQAPAQPQQPSTKVQCAHSQCPGLSASALAAAVAGNWPVFLELLDRLTGLHEGCGGAVMMGLEQRLLRGSEGAPDVAGLCGALLGAWVAARQQAGGRVRCELAGAVVAVVQAAGKRPVRAGFKG